MYNGTMAVFLSDILINYSEVRWIQRTLPSKNVQYLSDALDLKRKKKKGKKKRKKVEKV